MLVPTKAAIRALRSVCFVSFAPSCTVRACRAAYSTTKAKAEDVDEAPTIKRTRKSKAKTETITFDTSLPDYGHEAPTVKRTRKTKAKTETIRFDTSLPQGLLSNEASPLEDLEDAVTISQAYPTVVQQARNNMRKFEHCVLLTRVGSFYELYFEHAEQYGPLLGLKVGSKKTSAGPVPMAGFPFFQLDRFLKMLVQDHNKHVAISEEVANDPSQKVRSGGLMFDREVKRIITPGTLIDENFLSPLEHNYLLAITVARNDKPSDDTGDFMLSRVGLSWIDLSSGDFFTQTTDLDSLSSAVARIGPREVIVQQAEAKHIVGNTLISVLDGSGLRPSVSESPQAVLSSEDWASLLDDPSATDSIRAFNSEETQSANLLLHYVKGHLPGIKLKLQAPVRQSAEDYMIIDKNSLRGLEVTQTLRDGVFKGSLLQAVRRTSTESGARMLAQRLTSPSTSLTVINQRLDLVEELIGNEVLLTELGELLRRTYDTLRLVQKFSFGRGDADDLLALARTIRLTQQIRDLLGEFSSNKSSQLAHLCERFHSDGPNQVAERILQAIDEEGLTLQQQSLEMKEVEAAGLARNVLEQQASITEMSDLKKSLSTKRFNKQVEAEVDKPTTEDIWIMRYDASPVLKNLHDKLTSLYNDKQQLADDLKAQLNATTLTLKLTPGLGHICHIKGRDTRIDLTSLPDARTVSSSKSTRSFYLPTWTRLGSQIEDLKLRIRAEEQSIFHSLRDLVIQNLVLLRRNASILDSLDVATSSARLAQEFNLKRPILNHSTNHAIYSGRHMTVEAGLLSSGRQFIPNDCILTPTERLWLITGPNMAGKSTFLRQTALISILAQTGSFVPAAFAELGLVDQIFSRIGSADNLSQDQSTFMVEMLETAHILRHATSRSFVIMDEVGRGTTPEDGIAVGYAVLNHLQKVSKCRTLFATHFHALADMTKEFAGLACYCTNVVEEGQGRWRYDHRVRRGVNRQSHALKVAKLAVMPKEVVKTASEVLKSLGDESVDVEV